MAEPKGMYSSDNSENLMESVARNLFYQLCFLSAAGPEVTQVRV